jgi:hypothetical protein
LVGWIQIQEGTNDPQKKKKIKKLHGLKCWMFFLRASPVAKKECPSRRTRVQEIAIFIVKI